MEEFKNKDSFKITKAMKNNSARGIALLQKQNKEPSESIQQFHEQISKEELSLDEVKRLYSFLSKAKDSYSVLNRTPEGTPDLKSSEYLAAGGSCALAWTRLILREENILKSYQKDITEEDLEQEEQLIGIRLPISKSLDEELKQVTYIAMQEGTDEHGDYVSLDEIRKAKESFNNSLQRANLFHLSMTDDFSCIESFLAPCDMILNNHLVTKGTWLMTLEVHSDTLWQMIKDEDIVGISIRAYADVEELDDE